MQILLSRTQAGPGGTVKQEQEEISPNHVQGLNLISVLYLLRVVLLYFSNFAFWTTCTSLIWIRSPTSRMRVCRTLLTPSSADIPVLVVKIVQRWKIDRFDHRRYLGSFSPSFLPKLRQEAILSFSLFSSPEVMDSVYVQTSSL